MIHLLTVRFNSAAMQAPKMGVLLLIPLLLFWAGCGGAKKTAQTDAQRPASTLADTAPVPVVTEPISETERYENASVSPAALVLPNIYFDFDRSHLGPEALQTLAEHARTLKAYPRVKLMIEGHCDERGTVEYNLALGDRRAKAAKDYLTSLGIGPERISTISYGKERPAAYGQNEEAWAKNRRAEFKVVPESET